MQKILIFTDSFLPGYKGGGPITSIANLVLLLNDNFDILICTSNHDFGDTQPYNLPYDKPIQYQDFNVIYLSKMDKISIQTVIQNFNPDLLYLNSFFSVTTQIVILLNKSYFNKSCIVAPRGELQENALAIKSFKKKTYLFLYKLLKIHKNIIFHSTDEIESISLEKHFDLKQISSLSNVVRVDSSQPLEKQEKELRLLFVSRISRKKNLLYALEVLKSVNVDISFDIYGPKEDIKYWKECQNIIDTLPKNISVIYKGSLSQEKIMIMMREYHAFLFPTFSENFGHVIVEAMQAGLVPIISDQTPWRNLEDYNAGWDIPLNEKERYKEVIETLYVMNNEAYSKKSLAIITYIHTKLNMQKLKKQYIDFFQKAITKGQ